MTVRRAAFGKPIAAGILAVSTLLAPAWAHAVAPGEMPWCPKETGSIQGPYVPDKKTAIRIYLAVRGVIAPRQSREFNIPVVLDHGDNWSVYFTKREYQPRVIRRRGGDELVVSAGGGMLDMLIDKCTGRIHRLSYSR